MAGRSTSALPGGPFSIDEVKEIMSQNYGSEVERALSETRYLLSVIDELKSAGLGSRGIIFGSRGSGMGHAFNAFVNEDGIAVLLDGQNGTLVKANNYVACYFVRTC